MAAGLGVSASAQTAGGFTFGQTLRSGDLNAALAKKQDALSYATGDLPYASAPSTLSKLPIGGAGNVLSVSGSGIPAWIDPATLSGVVLSFSGGSTGLTPSSATKGAVTLGGQLGATSGGTAQSSYTTGDVLYASATNTLAKLPIGSSGNVLTVSGGVPAWAPLSGVGVTSFSGGSTGLTTGGVTTGAITLSGVLAPGNGGTGQSSYAAGDLLYASGPSVLSRLTIGSGNQILRVSGGGPAWATPAAPTITVLTTGSGSYTTPAGTAYLHVRMVGGGGGGGGSLGAQSDGGNGGDSTFGSSLLVAHGGAKGTAATGGVGLGGVGGAPSLGGQPGFGVNGGNGENAQKGGSNAISVLGGRGGVGAFGGSSGGTANNGGSAPTNSGSGGAGGGTADPASTNPGGGGGGAGAYLEAYIASPSGSYSYAVGAAGAAGGGTGAGGAGGSGLIVVEAHFQ